LKTKGLQTRSRKGSLTALGLANPRNIQFTAIANLLSNSSSNFYFEALAYNWEGISRSIAFFISIVMTRVSCGIGNFYYPGSSEVSDLCEIFDRLFLSVISLLRVKE